MPNEVEDWWWVIIDIANEWQTLIGAVLALIAAWLAIRAVKKQIMLQQTQIELQKAEIQNSQLRRDDERRAREWAATSRFPDALSEICRYTEICSDNILDETEFDRREFPTNAIVILQNGIEHIDIVSAERLKELTRQYQIQKSRFFSSREVRRQNSNLMYDVALLRGYANSLFEYARGEEDAAPTGEISIADMITALNNSMGTRRRFSHEVLYNEVLARISRGHPGPGLPEQAPSV